MSETSRSRSGGIYSWAPSAGLPVLIRASGGTLVHRVQQGFQGGQLSPRLGPCRAGRRRGLISEGAPMTRYQPLAQQVQLAYEAEANSPSPDSRAVAELFRAGPRRGSQVRAQTNAPAV